MFRDWCPLCGRRFAGETPDEVLGQIAEHLEERGGEKSECERNWVSFREALADDRHEKGENGR